MTVLEVIQRTAPFLADKGIDSPRLQIELLLAHALKMRRLELYLNFERTLSETELVQLRALVRRRALREPLQHIVGSASFCGLDLQVNSSVLIPRPETETLAEKGWAYLQAHVAAQPEGSAVRALDFGTGSGCLAIALALKCAPVQVDALERSSAALATARANAQRHGVSERIHFILGDALTALNGPGVYQLIVGNPPYIPSAEIAQLQPEVRDFDPRDALDGGPDGLNYFRMLAQNAGAYLTGTGCLMLELGDNQAGAVRELLEAHHWLVESIEPDLNHCLRYVTARRRTEPSLGSGANPSNRSSPSPEPGAVGG